MIGFLMTRHLLQKKCCSCWCCHPISYLSSSVQDTRVCFPYIDCVMHHENHCVFQCFHCHKLLSSRLFLYSSVNRKRKHLSIYCSRWSWSSSFSCVIGNPGSENWAPRILFRLRSSRSWRSPMPINVMNLSIYTQTYRVYLPRFFFSNHDCIFFIFPASTHPNSNLISAIASAYFKCFILFYVVTNMTIINCFVEICLRQGPRHRYLSGLRHAPLRRPSHHKQHPSHHCQHWRLQLGIVKSVGKWSVIGWPFDRMRVAKLLATTRWDRFGPFHRQPRGQRGKSTTAHRLLSLTKMLVQRLNYGSVPPCFDLLYKDSTRKIGAS